MILIFVFFDSVRVRGLFYFPMIYIAISTIEWHHTCDRACARCESSLSPPFPLGHSPSLPSRILHSTARFEILMTLSRGSSLSFRDHDPSATEAFQITRAILMPLPPFYRHFAVCFLTRN